MYIDMKGILLGAWEWDEVVLQSNAEGCFFVSGAPRHSCDARQTRHRVVNSLCFDKKYARG